MATKLFFLGVTSGLESDYGTGNLDARLGGAAHTGWVNCRLSTSQGAGPVSAATANALAGPTNGIEVGSSSTQPRVWYSAPLNADITISGSITWNLWAAENAMTDNVAANGIIEVIDGATGTITLIDKTANATEMAVTTRAVVNFAETPASGVACKRGDRLRVRLFGDDGGGTMAVGGAFTIGTNGATPGADGDSWLSLTENLTFVSEPAATTVYPTDTASAVSTASVDREAWTSRGAGVQTDVRNSTAGYTTPLQFTDTAGGTVVDWFTRQLAAVTLGGAVRVNARMGMSVGATGVPRCEVAVVASDGSSPTVWAAGTLGGAASLPTGETAYSFLISGDDLAVTDGQRLRIRFYLDDGPAAMVTARTATLYYAGTSGGASGDTYLTFTQTLTEYTPNITVTPTTAALVATKFAPTVTASDHQLVTVSPAGGAGYAATVLTDSPAGYWRMGEASGSVLDSIGSNHGTASGTVTRDVTGALVAGDDGAITFGGGYVRVTDHAALDLADVVTVEAWVNVPASAGDKGIVGKDTGTYYLRLDASTNKLTFIKANIAVIVQSTSNVPGTGWHHVAATKNGSTVKLYIDGADVTGTVTNATLVNNALDLYIGAADIVNEKMAGSIDEAAVYGTALSAARILAHYTAGTTGGGLVLTTYAPTVTVAAPQLVTPTTATVVLATFAPAVTFTDNQLVTPTTKAAVLATFAPSVTATDPQLVTPTTTAVTLTTFAPTVTAAAHQQVTPTTVALTLQAFAPTVTASDQQTVTPTTKALTLATFAPVVSTPQTVTPAAISLALATFAPTVSNPDPQLVTPTTASLITAKYAPSVGVSDAASIVPPNAALSLTTYAPTVIQPDPQLVTPTTPALELQAFAPTVTATAHQAVIPTTAGLVTTRHIPTVAATANQSAIPATKALTLTAYAPAVTVNNIVATVTIGLTLTTFAPSVTAGTDTYAFPDPASLTLTGYAPFIDLSAFKLVTPTTAVLVITTYPPTAEQHSITPLPTPIYGFAVIATGPGAGVGSGNGGATVTTSEGGSTAVSSSGPSARVTIR